MESVGRFTLIRSLGSGGMGDVFLVCDPEGGTVVLKRLRSVLSVEILRRFEREYEVLSGLDHPNIVPVLEFGRDRGREPYFTMPHLEDAETLDRWLARRALAGERPERGVVIALFAGLAAGLDHLHARGVFHRDLKPTNILVESPARARLIDFGLAGLVQSELTRTGTILGTMTYLSPELALGCEATAASDVFQVGLLLYRVMTGCDAVQDPAAYVACLRHGEVAVSPPRQRDPRLGSAVEVVILRALHREPGERPRSGADLVGALERIPEEEWWPEEREAPRETPRLSSRATWLIATGSGSVLLAAGLLVSLFHEPELVASPVVSLGFEAADLTVEADREVPVEIEVISVTSGSRRIPAPVARRQHIRLANLGSGAALTYRVRLDGREAPVFEGQLVAPGAPAVASLRFGGPSRLVIDLTAPAAVDVDLRSPGAGPLRVSSEGTAVHHELDLPSSPPPGPCEIRLDVVSPLGERVALPERTLVR